jgi:hypothetical protein
MVANLWGSMVFPSKHSMINQDYHAGCHRCDRHSGGFDLAHWSVSAPQPQSAGKPRCARLGPHLSCLLNILWPGALADRSPVRPGPPIRVRGRCISHSFWRMLPSLKRGCALCARAVLTSTIPVTAPAASLLRRRIGRRKRGEGTAKHPPPGDTGRCEVQGRRAFHAWNA